MLACITLLWRRSGRAAPFPLVWKLSLSQGEDHSLCVSPVTFKLRNLSDNAKYAQFQFVRPNSASSQCGRERPSTIRLRSRQAR